MRYHILEILCMGRTTCTSTVTVVSRRGKKGNELILTCLVKQLLRRAAAVIKNKGGSTGWLTPDFASLDAWVHCLLTNRLHYNKCIAQKDGQAVGHIWHLPENGRHWFAQVFCSFVYWAHSYHLTVNQQQATPYRLFLPKSEPGHKFCPLVLYFPLLLYLFAPRGKYRMHGNLVSLNLSFIHSYIPFLLSFRDRVPI